ncbi:pentatricopeptide repeat-containing protein At5g62370-like [Dioscorea cayenensis subsp. rotundata]|uniref:Pentatricopeptide repeat-containing protein At5g62370-like n=1 Tax=Dioscorea cayennensis subsp. rotundata TaxID=55577 RepID=A0AB40C588_DIOCR|nr:pentatricopeptide repeat-containing protein At5g62370-like [Dioscorea cayenensis subsp. rotundata]
MFFDPQPRLPSPTLTSQPSPPPPCLRRFASSSIPPKLSASSSSLPVAMPSHSDHCFSFFASFLRRGLPSVALSVRYASSSSVGLPMDPARVLRTLLSSRQFTKASQVFLSFTSPSISDPSLLDSMLLCYCKLRDLPRAQSLFNSIIQLGTLPSLASYGTLLRLLCVKEQSSHALSLFFRMAKAGVLPPASSYHVLITRLCSEGYLNEACFLFDVMLGDGIRPSLPLLKFLTYGFCKWHRMLEAERVFRLMKSHGFVLDRKLCTAMIHGYFREGRISLALDLFKELKERIDCEPDVCLYTTMIHGFLKFNFVDEGWELFHEMVGCGLQPNVVTFNTMISWYCKNSDVDSALALLDTMKSYGLTPNLHCYTAVITALCRAKRLVEVEKWFEKMLDCGLIPDDRMFQLLIKNLPFDHMSWTMGKVLDHLSRNGCNISVSRFVRLCTSDSDEELQREVRLLFDEMAGNNIISLKVVLHILLGSVCSLGKFNIAHLLMENMVDHGSAPSISHYNFLMTCLCKEDRIDDAYSLLCLMRSRGVLPDLATHSIVINFHCKRGDIDLALIAFDEMIQQGFRLPVDVYNSIIRSLCKAGRMMEAQLTFDRMLQAGIMPDKGIYTALINGYSKMGKIVDARYLFDEMVCRDIRLSSHAYNALINGLVKTNMFRMAGKYLHMMLENGFVPDTVLYNMLINQFFKKGDVRFGLDLFALMVRNQVEPDIITFGAVINGICRNVSRHEKMKLSLAVKLEEARCLLFKLLSRNTIVPGKLTQNVRCGTTKEKIELAIEYILHLPDVGLVPDLYIYTGMINGFCRANMRNNVNALIDSMDKAGVVINHVACTILIGAHINSGEIDCATELFNQMNRNGCMADNVTLDTLIKGYSIAERGMEALSLFYMMRKRGFFPSKSSCHRLLDCLCLSHASDLAFRLFEEMVLLGYMEEESLQAAHKTFDVMLKRGKTPDNEAKKQLLNVCYKHGEYDLAFVIDKNIPVYEVLPEG